MSTLFQILTFCQRLIEFLMKGGFDKKRHDNEAENIFAVGTDKYAFCPFFFIFFKKAIFVQNFIRRPSHVTDELLLISEQRRIKANQLKWKKEAEAMEDARKRFREKLHEEDEDQFKISKLIVAPRHLGDELSDPGKIFLSFNYI